MLYVGVIFMGNNICAECFTGCVLDFLIFEHIENGVVYIKYVCQIDLVAVLLQPRGGL